MAMPSPQGTEAPRFFRSLPISGGISTFFTAGAATLKVVENENNASIVEAMIGSKWGGRPIRVEFSSQQPREKKRERRYFDEIPPCSLCGAKDHESYEL